MNREKIWAILCLHILLFVSSIGGIFSKLAASFSFLSWQFIGCYFILIIILGIYAIGWQQIIKKLSLTLAYVNKAPAMIWACVWSVLVFHEHISVGKMIGVFIIIIGIMLYALSEEKENG